MTKAKSPKLDVVKGKSSLAPLTVRNLKGEAWNPEKIEVKTFRKMRNEYQIAACLNVWAFTLRKVDWYLEGGDDEVRDKMEESLRKIWIKVIKIVSKSLWAGYSPATKEFEFDKKLKIINYKDLHDLAPESCRVKVNQSGGFEGFWQLAGLATTLNDDDLIDPLYAFWYPNMMIDGNLYGESLLRGAYNAWYFSELTHLFANRYFERFGEPAVKGRAPATTVTNASTGENVDAMAMMQEVGEKIKSHSVMTIPSDRDENGNLMFDIEYMESNMRGVDFNMYLGRLDMEKARAIFVPDLLLGTGRVGSFELGKEHKATFLAAVQGMFDDITEFVQKYLIQPLVEINYGSEKEVPKFRYLPLTPVDQDTIAKIISEAVRTGSVNLDIEKLARTIGIPTLEADELVNQDDTKPKDSTQIEEDTDVEDVKNQAIIKKQYDRVSKFVTNIYQSKSDYQEKLIALESVNIGYKEHFNKGGFNLDRWHKRQKGVREYLVSSFQQHVSLSEVLANLGKVIGITTAEEYFTKKAESLAQEIGTITE